MMNSTYSNIETVRDQQWRLQFLEQVLFQEATPWYFVPCLPIFDVRNRPTRHLAGKLKVPTNDDPNREVETYFLQLEINEATKKEQLEPEPPVTQVIAR
eukprot:4453778-Prymnesium_polylepis.1